MKSIYPYLVTSDYPININSGKSVPIGHNIYIEWVIDKKGTVKGIDISKEKQPKKIKDIAQQNLITAFKTNIQALKFDDGPNSSPYILIGNHWTAATQILNPNLYPWAKKILNSTELIISIPNRDTMLIFPDCGKLYNQNIEEFVKEKEDNVRKQLTFELYKLNMDGLKAID